MADKKEKDESVETSAEDTAKDEQEPVEAEETVTDSDEAKPDTEKTEVHHKPAASVAAPAQNKFKRLLDRYWVKKKWTLPATVLALLVIILAIPFTRYTTLGLFLKGPVTVSLVDSVSNTPVSSASVTVGGHSFNTNADGKVNTKLNLGGKTLTVTKQYYKTTTEHVTVTFSKAHNSFTYHLVANGRLVPITVIDKVTGKPIAGAQIVVASAKSTAAKTDKKGKATIVLPTKTTNEKASVTAPGFNDLQTTVQITGKDVAANHFNLTPSGKLYFLSNQSGKIDVVKTNLDGTDRQTVLAGTGHEEPYSTSLLASQDWKYLALLSRREGDNASVYLIDTSNDKVTTIDEGKASFTFVGWAGDSFAYYVNRGYQSWQPKNTAIKTYDANAKKLNVVYETGASGDQNNYGTENLLWIQQAGTKLVWYTTWSTYHGYYYSNQLGQIDGKQSQVVEYDTTKNIKKTLKGYPTNDAVLNYSFGANPFTSYQSVAYKPGEIYFIVNSNDANNNTFYDEYDNGTVSENNDDAKAYFQGNQNAYPTYLLSPSNKASFWSEQRDGKNALFVGNDEGDSGKQIATLSEYQTYGWFTDDYLLVSKNGSELYIMAADGSTPPQKISDYYKPPLTYRGYGGGYGGI